MDLQIAEGRSLDVITQAETLTPFSSALGADYERYTAGTVMLETAERVVPEEREPAVPPRAKFFRRELQQFLLLVGGLRTMAAGVQTPSQVLDSYLLRSLSVAGYAPSFDHCARCGDPGPHRWFNPSAGGILCSDCRLPGSASPSPATVLVLGALLAGEWEAVRATDQRSLRDASGLIAAFVAWHLERGLRSLDYVER